jgi:hypothetical protein
MNSTKHVAEPAGNAAGTGRIASLNMTSGAGRLSYDSLMEDMTTANDYSADVGCSHCHLWA